MGEVKQIEFIDLWEIMKKRINMIIFITLGVVLIVGLINYCFIRPLYEAESSLIIGTAPEKNGVINDSNSVDIYMYQNLMKTYSKIAASQLVINSTTEKLKNIKSDEDILKNITVTIQENTQIMTIKYTSEDPKEAKTTLDTFIECFIEQTQKIYPTDSINIIDKPKIPKHPVKPNKVYNLTMAFFIALSLSIGLTFLLDYMDNTLKSETDIEKYLKVPIIGTIPNNIDSNSFINTDYPCFEIYRILKNNIEFSSGNKKVHSVVITSAGSGEGKTTFASNLAVAFAEQGNNTIILDCNLRSPKLHEIFEILNTKGLSNFITDNIGYEEIINLTHKKNLYLITSGSNAYNPSEIIASPKMENLMEFLKEKFDYIIIDAPKVVMLSDTQILSRYCDGCVMIVSSNDSKRDVAIKAKELLMKVNTKIIGAVLNNRRGCRL